VNMQRPFFNRLYLVFYFGFLLLYCSTLEAQETKIFTTEDYDLQGPVKNCQVLTNYGREEFDFNREGKLTKAVTRYNDQDYSITYYKYRDGFLSERRDEVYRDGKFDENSSMAHFFEPDTLNGKRIKEQIVSYNKEYIDRYEYSYDEEGRLVRMVRSSPEGVDETRIEYSEQKGEATTSYFLNEVLLKTIRTSAATAKDGSPQRDELTKEFIDGAPDKASEMIYNAAGKPVSEVQFEYSKTEKSFVPVSKITFEYNEDGMLSQMQTQAGGQTETRKYIYQFDNNGNWIKQIITPDNSYITRKISYYQPESAEQESNN